MCAFCSPKMANGKRILGAPARMRAATLMGKMAIGHLINRFGKGTALAVPPGHAEKQGFSP